VKTSHHIQLYSLSVEVVNTAFLSTDEDFVAMARRQQEQKPLIAYQERVV